MMHDHVVLEVLTALDQMEREVTNWEASFLESLMRQTYAITAKQRAVLVKMVEEYLGNELLVAELRGQQRLFAKEEATP